MAKDLKVVGKNIERIDAMAKVTGEAIYTVDVRLNGMLHAKFLRSPHPHARIIKIDTSRAGKMAGVKAVVSHKDLIGSHLEEDILDDRVRFLGEAVAGVAAETEEIAREAVRLIQVEYQVLPALLSAEEAMKPGAVPLWSGGNICTESGPVGVNKGPSSHWKKGDPQKGFSEADYIIENAVETHVQFHACFEPHACVARWEPALRELTFWTSTQSIYKSREHLAGFLKIPMDRIHVICPYVGGGFGGKLGGNLKEHHMTVLLSVKTCRPVRFEPSREEESTTTALRHPAKFYYKVGGKKDGSISGIFLKCIRSGGPHTSLQMRFLDGSTDYVVPNYFNCPNVEYEGWSVYDNLPICAAYRGFGYFESGTALDQTIDMLAEKIGMDPIEFWRRNVPRAGYRIGREQGPLTTSGIEETVKRCAEAIHWKEKWHKPGQMKLADGRKHGIGIGHALGRTTLPPFIEPGGGLVKVGTDGKVQLLVGISDMGQGQATGLGQIAAEVLGLTMSDITVTWGDSIAPFTNFQAASSTTMMTGNAVKVAAENVKQQMFSLASPLLKVDPRDLDIGDGQIYVSSNPHIRISLAKIVSRPGIKTIIGHGRWSIYDKEASPRVPVVCIVEVAVDTETGKVEVIRMVQGTDCGRAISRTRVEGQLQGVLSGGIGFVLLEDRVMDESRGLIINGNFLDYKMVTAMDTHDVLEPCIIVEQPDPVGPFGARGMGEAVLSAAGPAILNAVYNAIGIRFRRTPVTPDAVLRALTGKGGGNEVI